MIDFFTRHWQLTVLFLTINGIIGDILCKKNYVWQAVLLWQLGIAGWVILFTKNVPLGRSVTLNCIISYVLTGIVAYTIFNERITISQGIGVVLGLIAIALLA